MDILGMLFGTPEGQPEAPVRPAPVPVRERDHTVYAACSGRLLPMEELPDPLFASGAMGPTVGIKPCEGLVYAPVSGVVTMTTKTCHAFGLRTGEGLEVLVHAGVDTVDLRGEGLHGFVEQGQRVIAGEPLLLMDLPLIAQAGRSDVVITSLIGGVDRLRVSCVEACEVTAGEAVMALLS